MNYSYSTSNRNDFSGYVGVQVVFSSFTGTFRLSRIALPYQASNGVNTTWNVYVLNSTGGLVANYTLTVLTGAAFAYSYVNTSVNIAANTTYYVMIQTTAGGSFWNDVLGNPTASRNLIPPSSQYVVASTTSYTGAWNYSLTLPNLFGGGYSYTGVNIAGYTF